MFCLLSAQLIILVTDVNDNSPACPLRTDRILQVEENKEIGSLVTTVMAIDPDSNDRLFFMLEDNLQSESSFFAIDRLTGEVSTIR